MIYRIIVYQMIRIHAERGSNVFVVKIYQNETRAHFTADSFEGSLKEFFGMKSKKALKPGSVPSIFPFLKRKPEREFSYKRAQIKKSLHK